MIELQKATRKFIAICRDEGNEAIHTAAVEYAKAMESYISALEQENDALNYNTSKMLKEVNMYVDILKSYGVDVNALANRSIYTVMGDIELANKYGIVRTPENLQNHIR
jgi:hypothetical protein